MHLQQLCQRNLLLQSGSQASGRADLHLQLKQVLPKRRHRLAVSMSSPTVQLCKRASMPSASIATSWRLSPEALARWDAAAPSLRRHLQQPRGQVGAVGSGMPQGVHTAGTPAKPQTTQVGHQARQHKVRQTHEMFASAVTGTLAPEQHACQWQHAAHHWPGASLLSSRISCRHFGWPTTSNPVANRQTCMTRGPLLLLRCRPSQAYSTKRVPTDTRARSSLQHSQPLRGPNAPAVSFGAGAESYAGTQPAPCFTQWHALPCRCQEYTVEAQQRQQLQTRRRAQLTQSQTHRPWQALANTTSGLQGVLGRANGVDSAMEAQLLHHLEASPACPSLDVEHQQPAAPAARQDVSSAASQLSDAPDHRDAAAAPAFQSILPLCSKLLAACIPSCTLAYVYSSPELAGKSAKA